MEKLHIGKIAPEHIDELQKISRQTFYQAFSDKNTEEDMQKYLNKSFSKEQLLNELHNEASAFYFAKLDNRVIGYLKLNWGTSQTEAQDDAALEIERIYVLDEFLGQKVGQLLYEKAREKAKETHVDYIWLGVWEENARAIAFYKKNGFVPFDKHLFMLGNDEQTDIMMKLQIKTP